MQRFEQFGLDSDGGWMDLDVVVFVYFEGESMMKRSKNSRHSLGR